MRALTLRQLEYIVAVAEHRHFSHAARACSVSQPALSKQVQEAERALGVELFERARPRLLITASGQAVVAQAHKVLTEARELEHVAAQARFADGGTLALGVIPTLAPFLLPTLLVALKATLPRLEVRLLELPTYPLLDALRVGQVDLALLALPVQGDDFAGRALFSEDFVLALPPAHPLCGGGFVALDDLHDHALLLMEEGHCFRDHALSVCDISGAHEDRRVRATSLATLALMASHGLGATLLPACALANSRAIAPLHLRPFADDAPSRVVGLRWRATSSREHLFARIGALILDGLDEMDAAARALLDEPPARLIRPIDIDA